jgi:cytochrome c oxidase accessory protein FixG
MCWPRMCGGFPTSVTRHDLRPDGRATLQGSLVDCALGAQPRMTESTRFPTQERAAFADQAHQKVYPRRVSGRFTQWRWVMVFLTQLVFYGLPWLEWGQRQAVLFDLEARRFYLLGLVLYPQDFIYLTGLLVISALALFLFTAVAGRLWCGYACPQTVYTEIFLWIEQRCEGDRSARMRLDGGGLSGNKLLRKGAKHLAWLAVALVTGLTFVGYFTPIRSLVAGSAALQLSHWEWFWIVFYGLATYGNAGWMREQVCKYMCPYARFQGAMFDKDTLIVTYDTGRGEPRGTRKRDGLAMAAADTGHCVDCSLCVQVCPTGIDIRKGLQYECIGCGACADACDTVMDKLQLPRGLVRYSTEHALARGWTQADILRRVFRPRVWVYAGMLMAVVLAMAAALVLRTPFKADVVRDRASLSRIVGGGKIANVYRLQIMNATERELRFRVSAEGLEGLSVAPVAPITVGSSAAVWVPIEVQLPFDGAAPGSHPMHFIIAALDGTGQLSEKSVFIVPH